MYEDQEYAEIFSTFAFELRLRSLVNRASDSGSEGRGLESLRGHERKVLHNLWIVKDFFYVLYLGIFVCFRFLLSNGFRLKKDSRLSQDSYLYINLISIMKNNSYSVHARLHDCSLSKRAMEISIALLLREQWRFPLR